MVLPRSLYRHNKIGSKRNMSNWSLYFYALLYTVILSIVYWYILGTDDDKNYDNLIFILYNVVFATTVINFVEPERLLLFKNSVLHVIFASLVYVFSGLGFRFIGKNTPNNLSLETGNGESTGAIVLLVLTIVLYTGVVAYHLYLYCKKEEFGRELFYYLAYLLVCVVLILIASLAYTENIEIHLHHYIVALIFAYGLVADRVIIIYFFYVALGIFVEGINTWGPDPVFSKPELKEVL